MAPGERFSGGDYGAAVLLSDPVRADDGMVGAALGSPDALAIPDGILVPVVVFCGTDGFRWEGRIVVGCNAMARWSACVVSGWNNRYGRAVFNRRFAGLPSARICGLTHLI